MDFATLASQLAQMVPFARHLSIDVVEVGPGHGLARLPDAPVLLNHVGTQHAGALYSVAETASGAAVLGAFLDEMGRFVPIVRSAEIRYVKPARGVVTARARMSEAIDAVKTRLHAEGRADCDVVVELEAGGVRVVECTFRWPPRRLTTRRYSMRTLLPRSMS
jgi:acyl-coenzyme A thioesterase PaaI-like protein